MKLEKQMLSLKYFLKVFRNPHLFAKGGFENIVCSDNICTIVKKKKVGEIIAFML